MGNKLANCTTIFMAPHFGAGKERLLQNGYIGAYLGDVNKLDDKYKGGIYFLFKPESITEFQDFLYDEKERGAPIVEDYDYEGGYVVVVYVLNEKFSSDFDKFLKGEYSKFSEEFKNSLPKTITVDGAFGTGREEITVQYRVINKDDSIREYWEDKLDVDMGDGELWSSPDDSVKGDEYLDITKIKGG